MAWVAVSNTALLSTVILTVSNMSLCNMPPSVFTDSLLRCCASRRACAISRAIAAGQLQAAAGVGIELVDARYQRSERYRVFTAYSAGGGRARTECTCTSHGFAQLRQHVRQRLAHIIGTDVGVEVDARATCDLQSERDEVADEGVMRSETVCGRHAHGCRLDMIPLRLDFIRLPRGIERRAVQMVELQQGVEVFVHVGAFLQDAFFEVLAVVV